MQINKENNFSEFQVDQDNSPAEFQLDNNSPTGMQLDKDNYSSGLQSGPQAGPQASDQAGPESFGEQMAEAGPESSGEQVAEAGPESSGEQMAEAGPESSDEQIAQAGPQASTKLMAQAGPQKSDFVIKDHYTFQELLNLMAFLRSPEGCPWDRVQSHDSIKGSMIEEAWEAVDAIESGKPERLQDELGDVLLQVIFHAQIAQDAGEFSIDEVIAGLCHKLISRHSHIFGQDQADDPDAVLKTWAENKKVEKGLSSETDVLRDVPRHIPALSRSYKLQKKAADCGFDWPDVSGAASKIQEEASELFAVQVEQDLSPEDRKKRLEEEGGDLLFAVVNVLRFLKVDPELALNQANDKFLRRFAGVEAKAMAQGKELREMNLEEMDALWNEVKDEESSPCV